MQYGLFHDTKKSHCSLSYLYLSCKKAAQVNFDDIESTFFSRFCSLFCHDKGRANSKFFKGKPTQRKLTSQHPYAERYIGKPYVYTVNVNNPKEVEAALEDMDDKVVSCIFNAFFVFFIFKYERVI